MLVVTIQQGRYYTTLIRLRNAVASNRILKEEENSLIYFKTLDGQLIHCTSCASVNNDLIELPPSLVNIKY